MSGQERTAKAGAKRWVPVVCVAALVLLLAPAMAWADVPPQLNGTETRVTSDPGDQYDPSISGTRVVFTDYRAADTDVYWTDLTTGQEHPVIVAPGNQELTGISGDLLVYTDYRSADTCLFDTVTGVTTDLTAPDKAVLGRNFNSVDPAISGALVAWEDSRDGNIEIYAMNIVTGEERRISDCGCVDAKPSVSDGRITWQKCPSEGGNCSVWYYDWATGQAHPIPTPSTMDTRQPTIYGDFIVWQAMVYNDQNTAPIGDQDIYSYDIATGVTERLALAGDQADPHATIDSAGKLAVSFDDLSEGVYHIRLWYPATGKVYQVTSGSAGQYLNAIDGDRIVYTDDRNGDLDIYAFTYTPPTHAVTLSQTGSGAICLGSGTAQATSPVAVNEGSDQSFTIRPDAGCSVTDITLDGTSVLAAAVGPAADGSYAFAVHDVLADHTLNVVFTSHVDLAPVVGVAGAGSSSEGSQFALSGTFTDPDSTSWTATVDFGDGTGVQPLPLQGEGFTLHHVFADNGVFTVTVAVTDDGAQIGSAATVVTVANAAPSVGAVSVPADPVKVGTPVNVSASFADPGAMDTHVAVWSWDGATSAGTVSEKNGSGTVSGTHTYAQTGVYTVKLTVTDKDGGAATVAAVDYVVVYDPTAGGVIGAGWFASPAGAYVADPTITGTAAFGFLARYKKGAVEPCGATEFVLVAGRLNFVSLDYEWLVISGAKATLEGSGTINGRGSYGFTLTGTDGRKLSGGGSDKVRLRIWDKNTGVTVYDTQPGAAVSADPTMVIKGGNVIIS